MKRLTVAMLLLASLCLATWREAPFSVSVFISEDSILGVDSVDAIAIRATRLRGNIIGPNSATLTNGSAKMLTITEDSVFVSGILGATAWGGNLVGVDSGNATVLKATRVRSAKAILSDSLLGVNAALTGRATATDFSASDSVIGVTGAFSGRVTGADLSTADSLLAANGLFSARVSATDFTASDSVIGVTGTFSGALKALSLTFTNGTTVANGHADTVTVTEANIKLVGTTLLTGKFKSGSVVFDSASHGTVRDTLLFWAHDTAYALVKRP